MFKSITVIKNGKTFECECTPELGGSVCGVAIYEVKRPTWIIFRRVYRGYKTFWINDYNTITDGVVGMVEDYLDIQKLSEEYDEKWKEFENDC